MRAAAKTDVTLRWMAFLLIAVLGLAYVKWFPYYQRTLFAASHHSIGGSILMGAAPRPPEPSVAAALDYAWAYGNAVWKALALGLLLGSAVQVLLPPQWIFKAMGAMSFQSVALAGLLSLPGMMCTCCAAPVVTGLRSRQASPGAAVAFWLGNTMLNPATLVFTGFVLGWNWTALRLAFSAVMVFGLGYLINCRMGRAPLESLKLPPTKDPRTADAGNALARWFRLLLQMAIRLIPEYLILVLLLGAARAWLFPQAGPDVNNELAWIVAFAAAGAVFVVPTAGEVPIVQALLLLGVGAGPAAALLLTLPPISAPSVAMLLPTFGWRLLLLVGVSIVALGIAAGLLAVLLGF